jgi:DNA polymerase-1
MLRTIVKPPEGWVMMEADFCQAELFTLANLSGDPNMLSALTTPGKDLHDKTAVDAFRLTMLDEHDNVVTEDMLVQMAADLIDKGGAESEEFSSFMKHLRYRDTKGNIMTRDAFKSGIRVSAKSLNFGIPYGRGAKAIALQIKAETGTTQDLSQLEVEVQEMINSWKNTTFPVAWEYLTTQQQKVYNPGYIANVWGRRKYAHIRQGEQRADLEREFGNFPIQSTVADTMQIALHLVDKLRKERGLKFKIQNQIHDAIMLELPEEEIEACKQIMHETMGGIQIPTGRGDTFTLGVDIDLYSRWGEKIK